MVFVDFYPYVPPSVWMRVRPDAVTVWDDEDVKRRLDWYYRVMNDKAPAKFLIAKIVDAGENPAKLDLDGLWDLHHRLSSEHRRLWKEAIRGELELKEVLNRGSRPDYNFLHVKVEIAKRVLRSCRFCERKCSVNRYKHIGGCFLDWKTYVHSWFHHLGEEAPLVPSGTIFYGGCNFRCVYCQNYDISQVTPRSGSPISARQLAQIQYELRVHGARNINHVGGDPTPNIHTILESLLYLEVNVPQLWNSNMYLSLEGIELIKDIIDIWLPDFKYGNNKCATRLSAAPKYFETVARNLKMTCLGTM
ncbi:MAG TPA: radical SAM protein [Pyrodictiaceae archaeon]|nr:radical SAM protein [Pyrodictiaceae archaeon]